MGGWQTGGQGLTFYVCFRTPSKGLKHKHMQEKEQTWPLTKLWLGVLWLQGFLWRTPIWLIRLGCIWESIRPGASGSKKVHPCAVGDGHRLSETQKVCNAENLQRRKSAMQKNLQRRKSAMQILESDGWVFSNVSHSGRPGANSAMQKTEICNAEFGVRSSPTPARMRTAAACGPAKRLHKRPKHCFPLCIIASGIN